MPPPISMRLTRAIVVASMLLMALWLALAVQRVAGHANQAVAAALADPARR